MSKTLLLLLFLMKISKENITIIGPKELSSQFEDPLELEYANFGRLPSGFLSRGEIIIDIENESDEGCDYFPENFIYDNPKFESDFPIILIKRGGCSFVKKARNAQNAGAGMLIVINNDNENIHNLVMSDDGTGGDIYIPVAMISLNDGNVIYNYLKKNPWKKITTEVEFTDYYEENEEIDLEFFFSSHEERAYILIKNISNYINEFGNINFIPRYVTHQSPYYDNQKAQKIENCFSNGKYCYFPKRTGNVASYDIILLENLRQKCIFNLYNKRDINYYYDYMEYFYENCYSKSEFDAKCANEVIYDIGLKPKEIDECISTSFGIKKKISKIDYDKDNKIFEDEYNTQITYGLTSFPTITLNTVPIEGIIKEEKVILALCDKVENKPDFCDYYYEKANSSFGFGTWLLIILLLTVFLIVIVGLFYFCKNYITQRVHQRVYSGGLDLDGRINNAISNYFTLKESGKI